MTDSLTLTPVDRSTVPESSAHPTQSQARNRSGAVISDEITRDLSATDVVPLRDLTMALRSTGTSHGKHASTKTPDDLRNNSISAKLDHLQTLWPKIRSEEHAVSFYQAMQEYDAATTDKARKEILHGALSPFLQTYFPSLDVIEGATKVAGQWINMRAWTTESLVLASVVVGFMVNQIVGAVVSKHEQAHPGDQRLRNKLAPIAPTVGLVLSLSLLIINSIVSAKQVQPLLVHQRMDAALNPVRSGGAPNVDNTISEMKASTSEAKRVLAAADATDVRRDEVATRMHNAKVGYNEASGTSNQRQHLYMPENIISIAKMLGLAGTAWETYKISGSPGAAHVPHALLLYAAIYGGSWVLNYKFGGPKRAERMVRGALEVDFVKDAGEHVERLTGGDGTVAHVDDEALDWGRSTFRNPEQQRVALIQVLNKYDLENGPMLDIARTLDMLHADVVTYNNLRIKQQEKPDDFTAADLAKMQPLQDAYVGTHETVSKGPGAGELRRHEHRFLELNQDREILLAYAAHAAKDERSDVWKALSPRTKAHFDDGMSERPSMSFVTRYWQVLVRGERSSDPAVRFAARVAGEIKDDWREYDPDVHLSFALAYQFLTLGGSLATFILGNSFAVAKSLGHDPDTWVRAVGTAIPGAVYIGSRVYQGAQVSPTIMLRDSLKQSYPSKFEYDKGQVRKDYALHVWKNIWRLPEELYRQYDGTVARSALTGTQTQITAAQTTREAEVSQEEDNGRA